MRAPIVLFALASLAGCGLSPMYSTQQGQGPIGAVEVGMIPGLAGHTLRSELDRLLSTERGDGPARPLQVTLREEVINLGLRLDESATRAELRLTADYVLGPPAPGTAGREIRGSLLSVVNYEIPTGAFGVIAAQDDARERAAEVMAQRLRAELALRIAQERRG